MTSQESTTSQELTTSDESNPGRNVLLVVHTGREEATETARRVEKVLGEHGIGLRVLTAEAVDRGSLHLAPEEMRALGVDIEVVDADEQAAEGCELVLALGGDGTFLRAAELARNVEIPVLGINLGRIGFLAEAEADAIDTVLDHVIAKDYRVEERMTLDVAVREGGVVRDRGWALNEASLEKGPRLGVLGVVLEVDGRPVSQFGCDGVLVSTPTGSTAYAFSAGGPILWPDLESILVVPNNAHALFARPMVTSPDASIAIEVEAGGHDAVAFCDGRRKMAVPAGARLEVTRCGTPLKWVRLDSAPFTDRLVRKFRLPVKGWRGQ
ncbi:NAD kinase [Mycolicibacterium bacteremicum]|uniref:NAD kinase n=1 Tax=Mycolicibacterium bacteremicum TaxID=564198 RepID=UPI001F2CC081|nr:NAD kinase [Mycolicibacterium bacteremicum]